MPQVIRAESRQLVSPPLDEIVVNHHGFVSPPLQDGGLVVCMILIFIKVRQIFAKKCAQSGISGNLALTSGSQMPEDSGAHYRY